MTTYIVLLGPPGVGKGTQAVILAQTIKLAHISSGDLFRGNIKNQTELGKLAKSYMDKGELVPDDVTIAMVRDRISQPDCEGGAILDGFPRTPKQAEALEKMLSEFGGQVNAVPYITADEELLVERISGRWSCREQGHVYHEKFNPPKQNGVCDVDGSELYQRDDDKRETVANRIRVYFEQTMPLVDYYREMGKLIEINGAQDVEQVSKELLSALKK
jgi:adenylate kinase